MVTPEKNPQGVSPAGNPADYSFEPDAAMQAIISKRESGAKLTPSEGGKLGQWFKRVKNQFGGPAAGTKDAGSPASAPVVASATPATDAPLDGLPPVPPDADLVRRVTQSLLEGVNNIGHRKLSAAARARGANGETLRRCESAKVFGEDRKTLIVQTAPEAFEAMGITNGKAFALSVFWGNIGLGACDFWLAIDELNNMAKPAATAPAPQSAPTTPAATPGHITPVSPGQPSSLRIPQAEPPPPFKEKSDAS